jgi:hypothetical protein
LQVNLFVCFFVCLLVVNATFNTITFTSWQSVLLEEETEYPEKTTDLSQVTDKLYNIMLFTSSWSRFEHTILVVIGTDCIGSCKTNYHTIMTTTAPRNLNVFTVLQIRFNNNLFRISRNRYNYRQLRHRLYITASSVELKLLNAYLRGKGLGYIYDRRGSYMKKYVL